jgi:hypothetical protein
MDSDSRKSEAEGNLEGIDEGRREMLRRIVKGSVYAAPVVASFAIDGLTVSPALAGVSNFS